MADHIKDFNSFAVNEAKAKKEGSQDVDRKKIVELMIEDIFMDTPAEELVKDWFDSKMIDEITRMHDRLMDRMEDLIMKGKFDHVKTKADAEKAVRSLKGKL
jgi:guanylate kinase